MPDDQTWFQSALRRFALPVARRVIYRTIQPGPLGRPLYSALFHADWMGNEAFEWARRSLVATPTFLARCARHGDRISVDRLPYLVGPCRIELGSDIRISGKITIRGASRAHPLLRVGSGVFIGHGCSFNMVEGITIGDFASLGAMTFVADNEGHANYNPGRPIWEVPAAPRDIAPVVIEDNVQIGRECMILKGVRIGARSIIGARSVVRGDVPPDSVVMGNPARVVKRMTVA